ncbi:spore coat U domain-containing protein [Sphingomonas sp. MMS24-J13]|uniref:Csu type fimbrial protein n=1 Tax=Sphingomonas sp. MMS24-J13 TaxID=3238686 RepID=UPI00384B6AA3
MTKFAPLVAATMAGALVAVPAVATTVTSSFNVTANVQATCSVSATNMAFGAYTGVQLVSTSSLSITCTNTTGYAVGLDAGTATGATVTSRKMTGPAAATLGYGLYRDGGHTSNWGQTAGTDTVAGTGSGTAQSLTVYGLVPAGQTPPAGSYSDTITVTVSY